MTDVKATRAMMRAQNMMRVTHRRFSAAAADRPCWSSGFGQIARLCGDGYTVRHVEADNPVEPAKLFAFLQVREAFCLLVI